MAHSRIGPSAAHRWIVCPGSVKLCAALPVSEGGEKSSEYANEGTLGHALLEKMLRHNLEAFQVASEIPDEYTDMAGVLDASASTIKEFIADKSEEFGGEAPVMFLEGHAELAHIHPDMFGTFDIGLVWEKAGYAAAIDFKYGEGLWVEAADNEQINLYMEAFVAFLTENFLFVDTVEGFVFQPRMSEHLRSGGAMSVSDLSAWVDRVIRPALRLAEEPDAPFEAGEHCRFCPAVVYCPVARDLADSIVNSRLEGMPAGKLGLYMKYASFLRLYAKRIEEASLVRLQRGGEVEGWKLVAKRASRRTWDEEAEKKLVAKLGDKAYTAPKLISPAQAEKIGAKDIAKEHSIKTESNEAVMAPDSDPRPAIDRRVTSIFPART